MTPLHLALTLASCVPTLSYAQIKPNMTFSYFKNYNKEAVFLDLFDTKVVPKNQFTVAYINTQFEDWRPDAKDFPKSLLGKVLGNWKGERWVDYRDVRLFSILKKRIQKAKDLGYNAVDFDNIDGHLNDTGFKLKASDQLAFVRSITEYSHGLGLKTGLKNSAETAASLKPYFDFVVIEQCYFYKECGRYASFPVRFNIEYTPKSDSQCKLSPNMIFANKDLTRQEFCR